MQALDLGIALVDDDVGFVVEDALKVAHRDVEQRADTRRQRLKIPNMGNGYRQFDVAEALAADLGLGDLDAAAVAHVPAEADPLELAAVAFPVLHGPENALAEQSVALGLEGPVVDRLGLGDFAVRPTPNLLG